QQVPEAGLAQAAEAGHHAPALRLELEEHLAAVVGRMLAPDVPALGEALDEARRGRRRDPEPAGDFAGRGEAAVVVERPQHAHLRERDEAGRGLPGGDGEERGEEAVQGEIEFLRVAHLVRRPDITVTVISDTRESRFLPLKSGIRRAWV